MMHSTQYNIMPRIQKKSHQNLLVSIEQTNIYHQQSLNAPPAHKIASSYTSPHYYNTMHQSQCLPLSTPLYFINRQQSHPLYLTAKGFVDKNIYEAESCTPQSEFMLEQKNILPKQNSRRQMTQSLLFGTEILIRHVFSGHYLSVEVDSQENETLTLRDGPSIEECYFQILPIRTFEHKGDYVTNGSIFVVRNIKHKCYVGRNFFQKEQVKEKVRNILTNTPIFGGIRQEVEVPPLNLPLESPPGSRNYHSLSDDNPPSGRSMDDGTEQQFAQMVRTRTLRRLQARESVESSCLQRIGSTAVEPIYLPVGLGQSLTSAKECVIERHIHTMWQASTKKSPSHPFLTDNQYIYFTSSNKDKGLLNVNPHSEDGVDFVRTAGDHQYLCSALFQVEMAEQDKIYLKHIVSGRYFPFSPQNTPKCLKLVQLLPLSAIDSKLPPFHIFFDGQFFPNSMTQQRTTSGFWLNTADATNANNILSLQGTPHDQWIPYLIKYLDRNSAHPLPLQRRQQILDQFGLLTHIMKEVLPLLRNQSGIYDLLFRMINFNPSLRHKLAKRFSDLLPSQRQHIADIISQLLDNEDNLADRSTTPHHLQHFIRQFNREERHSVTYLRIFRVLCGHYSQPCLRNQNTLYPIFHSQSDKPVSASSIGSRNASLTASYIKVSQQSIEDQFKFRLTVEGNTVKVLNDGKSHNFQDLSSTHKGYLRQYVYLLGDCLKLNKQNITHFRKNGGYSLQDLLTILKDPSLQPLKGPILHVINTAFLQPQHPQQLYIFDKNYEGMCYRGGLVAKTSTIISQLVEFVKGELKNISSMSKLWEEGKNQPGSQKSVSNNSVQDRINEQYRSTHFRQLLVMIRLTIQNGYWESIEALEDIVATLATFCHQKQIPNSPSLANYEEINAWKNSLQSTILSIQIATLFLDIKINICLSTLITLPTHRVNEEIDRFVRQHHSKTNLRQHIGWLQGKRQDSRLVTKWLILCQKYYNLKDIIIQKYAEAVGEYQQPHDLRQAIARINLTLDSLRAQDQRSIQVCQSMIELCLSHFNLDQLHPQQVIAKGYLLRCLHGYKAALPHFQNLAAKMGLLDVVDSALRRYITLRSSEKALVLTPTYWKLLMGCCLIRDNPILRKRVIEWRQWLMQILKEKNQLFLVGADIIHEIYRGNRSLLVSDTGLFRQICEQVRAQLADGRNHASKETMPAIKLNRLLSLLMRLLKVGDRKLKNNFILVTNLLFDQETILRCIMKLKLFDSLQQHYRSRRNSALDGSPHIPLFKLLIFQLALLLQQKPRQIGYVLPEYQSLEKLLWQIQGSNWVLTRRIWQGIIEGTNTKNELHLLQNLRATVNLLAVNGLEHLLQHQNHSQEFKDIVRALPTILKAFQFIIERPNHEKSIPTIADLPVQFLDTTSQKEHLLERICLFRKYMTPELKEQLHQLIERHAKGLKLTEDKAKHLERLDLTMFEADEIRHSRNSLLQLRRPVPSLTPLQPLPVHSLPLMIRHPASHMPSNTVQLIPGNLNHLIHCLIRFNQTQPHLLSPSLTVFFISLLQQSFPVNPQPHELLAHQNKLIDSGTARLICLLLQGSFSQNYDTFSRLFQLGNSLLQQGNSNSQSAFLHIFQHDHKNTIFENILSIIDSCLLGVKFYYGYKSQWHNTQLDPIQQFSAREERQAMCEVLKQVFRFLQLLCQNDNQQMKMYVFSQCDEEGRVKYTSINFIQTAIYMLLQLGEMGQYNLAIPHRHQQARDHIMDCTLYILDFLIEVCQYPAIKNQIYLCNSDCFSFLPHLHRLREQSQPPATAHMLLTIDRKIVLLLRGLLEQRHERIIDKISKKISVEDLQGLIRASMASLELTSRSVLKHLESTEDKLSQEIENIEDILIIGRVLDSRIVDGFEGEQQAILNQIDRQIHEIEVDFKGQLTPIYFCYRPIFNHLSKHTRDFFVNQFSVKQFRNQKLRQLINSRHVVYQDITSHKLKQRIVSERGIGSMYNISILLCFVLVCLQMFFFSVNKTGLVLDNIERTIVNGLGFMQFAVTCLYCVLWGANIAPIAEQKMESREEGRRETGTVRLKVDYTMALMREIYLEEPQSIHVLLLFVLSFCACFIEVRLYSFVLLYFFAKIELLSSILTAIRLTWGKLLVVCLLAMAFTFIFGFLSINNYIKVLYEAQAVDIDIDHISSHCTSVGSCLDSLFTQRIIGETPSRHDDSLGAHYGRFFFDTVYWAFFDILLANIIAAIIIDKFAELRNIKDKIENEKRNRCFICSADKWAIQRKNQHFKEHVQSKHSVWNYFFYLYYLEKLKSHTEYTGIQYWIVRQVREGQIDWFPIDESLSQEYSERKIDTMFEAFRERLKREEQE